ncbi:MAG: TetR/AcrR family transcriptional regulator [Chloroflexi bacterium]|nr:TetR/AcrR family transcriptional regulator [Chloroflexota bacterium]
MTEEQASRQKILDAAFSEFAEKGFRGATIKSIAQAAGLKSPSLIYWYFPDKEKLFQAIVEARSPLLQAALDPSSLLYQSPENTLPLLAKGHLALMTEANVQRIVRLFFSEMGTRPQLADLISQNMMKPTLEFLKTYFTHQIEAGNLRPHDVRVSARAFIGMLLPQMFSMIFFSGFQADGLTNEEHVETAVTIFLKGLSVSASQPVS